MTKPGRILVVDDDELVRELLSELLAEHYDVLLAYDGARALEILAEEEVAVVLADQRMPRVTGIELAKEVGERYPDTVVVLLSAYTDPSAMIAAVNERQIFRFVRKPWENHDLLHTLEQAMARHALGQDNRRLVKALKAQVQGLDILRQSLVTTLREAEDAPMFVLLQNLGAALPYDLGVALMASDGGAPDHVRVDAIGRGSVDEAKELIDQAMAIYARQEGVDGARAAAHLVPQMHVDVLPKPSQSQPLVSHAHVLLRRAEEPCGVLLLASRQPGAFDDTAQDFLHGLATTTVETIDEVRGLRSKRRQSLAQAFEDLPFPMALVDEHGRAQIQNRAFASWRPMMDADEGLWRALDAQPEALMRSPMVFSDAQDKGFREYLVHCAPGGGDRFWVIAEDRSERLFAQAQRREMMALFSHEIRTPISSISAALDLLLEGFAGEIAEGPKRYLQMAAKARDGLAEIVDQVLELERYAQGQVPQLFSQCDLTDLLQTQVMAYEPLAAESRVQLRAQVPQNLRFICDEGRMRQVVTNLVGNAIKFSDRDSEILVQATDYEDGTGGRYCIIGIQNTGQPMDPQEVELVFERFEQGRAERAKGRGAGIGLNICRSVVDAHGGAVVVQSDASRTHFWVVWPNPPGADAAQVARALAAMPPRLDVIPTPPLYLPVPEAIDEAAPILVTAMVLSRHGIRSRLLSADSPRLQPPQDGDTAPRVFVGGHEGADGDGPSPQPLGLPRPADLESWALGWRELAHARRRHHSMDERLQPHIRHCLGAWGLGLEPSGDPTYRLELFDAEDSGEMAPTDAETIIALAARLCQDASHSGAFYRWLRKYQRQGQQCAMLWLRGLEIYRLTHGIAAEKELLAVIFQSLEGSSLKPVAFPRGIALTGDRDLVTETTLEMMDHWQGLVALHCNRGDPQVTSLVLGDERFAFPRVKVSFVGSDLDAAQAATILFEGESVAQWEPKKGNP